MSTLVDFRQSFFRRGLVIGLLLLFSLPNRAQWGKEWLHCPDGIRLDYSYATIAGGHETFPLGFGFSYSGIIFGDLFAISFGATLGGNWKDQNLTYTKGNFGYSLSSKFYGMGTLGFETGFMALQVGLGACSAQYAQIGSSNYTAEGVYVTQVEFHNKALFMVEPAAYFYIPIYAGFKIPIKIGYQFVPDAPVMNGWVIGGGIRVSLDNDDY